MNSVAMFAGLAFVVLTSPAVFFGAEWLSKASIVGPPLVATFGVTIMFGALSLVASQSFQLEQPLAELITIAFFGDDRWPT